MIKGIDALKISIVAVIFSVVSLSGRPAYAGAADKDAAIAIFKDWKCFNCHSIISHKIEVVEDKEEAARIREEEAKEGLERREPPDLSGTGKERDAKWIRLYLMKKKENKDRKHGKLFKGTKEELKTLSVWLESLKDTVEVPKKK